MIILIFITLAYTFFRGVYFIYLFQIKEYRFDRFFSRLRENGLLDTLYISRNRIPAISIRNILVLLFLSVSIVLLMLFALENIFIYYSLSFLIFFSPLLALTIVSLAVIFTEIPSQIFRHLLILQAVLKVRSSKSTFIGITGTYGKTSIKEYVSFLLSARYNVAKTEKNMNTAVGIAMGINRFLKKSTDYFVTEVGSYRLGETAQATWYIPFTYGILTGLGNQHLDLYGSRQALVKEETSLLEHIPESGRVYLNHHNTSIQNSLPEIKAQRIMYGFHHSDIKAKILSLRPESTQAQINYHGYEFTIMTHLPGEHSVLNLLPAIAIAMDCGMKPGEIVRRIADLKPVEGKLSVHIGRARATILNDAVNSNVDGFLAALAVLDTYPQKTKYIISQGIIELGVEKRASYERILQELYRINGKLLTTDPFFKKLDTKQGVMIFNDVLQLRDKIVQLMNKHTVVLLEGKLPEDIKKSIMN